MKTLLVFLLLALASVRPAFAELKTQTVDYQDGDVVLEGYLAYDDSFQGKRPGILVVHEWNGLGNYVKSRVDQLARLGYVAFAADIYGKGVRPTNAKESGEQAALYRKDRALMRQRARAGVKVLEQNEWVDPKRIAAIGYCFGGGVVLELARSGEPLAGVASFHGNLDTPDPKDARNIKGRVLVLQGGADKMTLSQVPTFEKEMQDANVDYTLITYPGALHGFTNPENKAPGQPVKYNEKADKASWKAMKEFFDRIFKS